MKRHHEDDPYSSTDSSTSSIQISHSVPKRLAIGENVQSNTINEGDLSPTSSNGSDLLSTTSNDSSLNSSHHQLCRCPNKDCVIHQIRSVPIELTTDHNPTYGRHNLILHYAHLERCRRHGNQIHQNSTLNS